MKYGRVMAQAVSRLEIHVRAFINPRGICDGSSGTGTGFFPEIFGFPCQYNSTVVVHIQYIIWLMNNRPVSGRSSETLSHTIDMGNMVKYITLF
jgi:hypothetical protein